MSAIVTRVADTRFEAMKKKKIHVSLAAERKVITAVKNGLRKLYYPTTPYYVKRLCEFKEKKDYYEVLDVDTLELRGRTYNFLFEVDGIIAKGFNLIIYLGRCLKETKLDEHAYEKRKKKNVV